MANSGVTPQRGVHAVAGSAGAHGQTRQSADDGAKSMRRRDGAESTRKHARGASERVAREEGNARCSARDGATARRRRGAMITRRRARRPAQTVAGCRAMPRAGNVCAARYRCTTRRSVGVRRAAAYTTKHRIRVPWSTKRNPRGVRSTTRRRGAKRHDSAECTQWREISAKQGEHAT